MKMPRRRARKLKTLAPQDDTDLALIRNQGARFIVYTYDAATVPEQQSPPHGWHTLDIECKGVFVHRGIKTVGQEPSWCRPNSEYHKALAPFFIPI